MAGVDTQQGVREVWVGQGFAVADAKLFPADTAFLARYPQCDQYLQAIRNIEQALSAGYEPDLSQYASRLPGEAISQIAESIGHAIGLEKKQPHIASVDDASEVYTPEPSEVIFDATRHLVEIAGSDAVPVVLRNMVDTLTARYEKGELNLFTLKALITGYLEPCFGYLKGQDPQETIQRALRPLLTEYGYGPRQEIVDTILTYRGMSGSMRIEHRPISNGTIKYYGKPFNIDGIDSNKSYSISELEIGVLAVFDLDTGEIAGILDVHPHVYAYEDIESSVTISLVSPDSAMRARTGRDNDRFQSDWKDFFGDFHTFFSDGYGEYVGPSFWTNHFFLALDHPNANYIPFEAKYYLWRLLKRQDAQTSRVITDLLNTYQDSMIWVVEAMEGNPQGLVAFGENIKHVLNDGVSAHDWSEENARQVVDALLSHLSDTEKFSIDSAGALLSPRERSSRDLQERIDFFVPTSRTLTREALTSLSQVKNLDDLIAAASFHGMAQYELKKSIGYLQALYGRGKTEKEPFEKNTLDEIQAGFARYPHADATYSIRVLSWLMHAVFNQSDVPIDERRKTLRAFMEHVVSLDVYGKEGARGYAGPAEFETERLAHALLSLRQEGKIPEHPTVLILGSGPATRVEGPSLDRYRQLLQEQDDSMRVIAFDMHPQSTDRYAGAGFAQGAIENLPIAPGSVDVVILHGSVFNNMLDVGELMRYHQAIASTMGERAILIHETGSPIPVRAMNQRYERMVAFNSLYPEEPFGAIGLIDRYRGFSTDPGFANALIYEHPMMVVLARLVGLHLLSPPADPVAFEELYKKLQDPEYLARVSRSVPDAYRTPFTLADPESDATGEAVNARMTYVYERSGPTDPLLSFLLEPAVDAKEQRVAETHSEAS